VGRTARIAKTWSAFWRRPSALGALVCLVVVAICMAWYLSLGDPRPPRPVPDGALRVVVFGDSLGYGFGAPRPQRDGFVPQLFERLLSERPGSTIRNLSKGGNRIADITREIVTGHGDADLVLIVAGGNDVRAVALPLGVARDEVALLVAARQRFPRAAVLLTDIPDVSPRREVPAPARLPFAALIALDNAVLRRTALAQGANVLPLYEISRRPDANAKAAVSKDGLHPSAFGYRALAEALWPELEEIVRRPR
jgi:lysophospholipase L1-like esterase